MTRQSRVEGSSTAPPTFTIASPAGAGWPGQCGGPGPRSKEVGAGAIAIIEVRGDVGPVLALARATGMGVGHFGLRTLPGIDTLVVARPDADRVLLFPHAGLAVLRRLIEALRRAGVAPGDAADEDPRVVAGDRQALAERLHTALCRAASPLAIDLLLDQPRRWEDLWAGSPGARPVDESHGRCLHRLIEPATVVAIGRPNVGKSSLLNALAGRTVSIVADEPGTTRDHVGILMNFAGVVARFIDAPGIEIRSDDPIQVEAQAIARSLIAASDLVLWCGDTASGFPDAGEFVPRLPADMIRVGTRCDLGSPAAGEPVDVSVSARTGAGLGDLVRLIRERLVPQAAMDDPGAWQFWSANQGRLGEPNPNGKVGPRPLH